MKLTSFAVQRRLAAGAILFGLLILGIYGLINIPVDFLPDITYPMVKVHIWWRGATPEEIDRNVADPIERQMMTVDNLDYLESSSIEGMYTLLVNFKYGVNIDVAYQDALAAMQRAARQLPSDIDPPIVVKADPSQLPVVQLTVRSDRWDLVKLRTWTENWLQDRLLTIPGVAGTEVVGGLKREIRIKLDPDILNKHGLTVPGILRILKQENIEQFGGRVTVGPREIIARTTGEFTSLEDIKNVAVAHKGLSRITLKDIAVVEDSHEEVRVITRLNGQPSVKLSVLKQANANTVEVAKAVSQKLKEMKPILPAGIELGTVENQADYIQSALNGVRNAALEAAFLVLLIIYLFLGSWRQVLILIIALPVILVINFGVMKAAGFSLNIFSLGGLVIAIGILLSNSIVVIENITRWIHMVRTKTEHNIQNNLNEIIINATTEVGVPVLAATLAFLALFTPFLMVPGLISLLFKELVLTITSIVVISLLIAITITPMISSLLLRNVLHSHKTSKFEQFFQRVSVSYETLLKKVIKRRYLVIASFTGLLLVSVFLFKQLGSEFLPQMDDGRIMVKVKLPTGTAVSETNRILAEIEKAIGDDRNIESIFTLAGGKVWGLYTYEIANEGELNIQLVPRSKRNISTKEYIEYLRPIVGKIPVPGGNAMVMQMKLKGIRKIGEADIEVKIKGEDIPILFNAAKKVAGLMNEIPELTNVYVSLDMTKPEYQTIIDREKASVVGVSVNDISDTMRSLITGAVATKYREKDEYYNIRVIVPEDKLVSKQNVEDLPIATRAGSNIRIRDVAKVIKATGPVEIIREDQIKEVIVRADAAGVSVGQALGKLKKIMAKEQWPEGYEISFGGQAQMMGEMIRTVLLIMVFAVIFSFIILTVQFNTAMYPALILGSVPFCLAGSIILMLIAGLPLGGTVIIGILVIIAAMVNDGVLLINFSEEIRKGKHIPPEESITQAARIRLRPMVMTTVAALIGFIPLALALEEGGDMLQPMAVAAIGGLGLEIFVVLFLVPCLYTIIYTKKSVESRK
ncbi:MAG: efflux RND transporter permease subunit [Candidatus Omnitrophica bacterium]|nr:efflux RND transporter permease subunit [Candidatus Omnitrophota bacterium]